ncbi:MAG: hypothetical protein JSS34_01020 [Proteobacteria bacterium]|nr:hypothetical protein [Pseudomonadota bacterium]
MMPGIFEKVGITGAFDPKGYWYAKNVELKDVLRTDWGEDMEFVLPKHELDPWAKSQLQERLERLCILEDGSYNSIETRRYP